MKLFLQQTGERRTPFIRILPGLLAIEKVQLQEELTLRETAFLLRQETYPFNHPDLDTSYNNIDIVSDVMDDRSLALLYLPRVFTLNHSDSVLVYKDSDSLSFLKTGNYLQVPQRTLTIRYQLLPSNHFG
ncbi:unnamed protein product [Adineta ricciae]|uniref:Uncharacterized protein n=1 Tax=Adineta ricciae TaxID=249248 RepID=A0A814R1T5_ADIRI|nr:unnamed protein product [Adineta ricciae]CAF1127575.1 unnamed protein product [Adineta ricciae]